MQSPENDHHKSKSAAGKQTLCTLSSTFLNTLKTTLESHTDFSKQTKIAETDEEHWIPHRFLKTYQIAETDEEWSEWLCPFLCFSSHFLWNNSWEWKNLHISELSLLRYTCAEIATIYPQCILGALVCVRKAQTNSIHESNKLANLTWCVSRGAIWRRWIDDC